MPAAPRALPFITAMHRGRLGHADPALTLRTYVHLRDDGLGEADFLDGARITNATHAAASRQ
jgi:hypothetical protein